MDKLQRWETEGMRGSSLRPHRGTWTGIDTDKRRRLKAAFPCNTDAEKQVSKWRSNSSHKTATEITHRESNRNESWCGLCSIASNSGNWRKEKLRKHRTWDLRRSHSRTAIKDTDRTQSARCGSQLELLEASSLMDQSFEISTQIPLHTHRELCYFTGFRREIQSAPHVSLSSLLTWLITQNGHKLTAPMAAGSRRSTRACAKVTAMYVGGQCPVPQGWWCLQITSAEGFQWSALPSHIYLC